MENEAQKISINKNPIPRPKLMDPLSRPPQVKSSIPPRVDSVLTSSIPLKEPAETVAITPETTTPVESMEEKKLILPQESVTAGSIFSQSSHVFWGGKKAKIIIWALSTLVVLLSAGSIYFYTQSKKEVSDSKMVELNQKDLNDTIVAVSKLMELPTDEAPTLATVSDLSKVKGQAFFKHALIGDKVLVYSIAKKVILYSPSKNKIIEVAPLIVNGPPQAVIMDTKSSATEQKVVIPVKTN